MRNNARLVVINSVWGHMGTYLPVCDVGVFSDMGSHVAGGGSNNADDTFIKEEVRKFLYEE